MPAASSACCATGAICVDGPAEDRLALHASASGSRRSWSSRSRVQARVWRDGVALRAVGAPDDRADARDVGRADDDGAGAVAEDERGRAVVEVE